jgi:hypothetical protein
VAGAICDAPASRCAFRRCRIRSPDIRKEESQLYVWKNVMEERKKETIGLSPDLNEAARRSSDGGARLGVTGAR